MFGKMKFFIIFIVLSIVVLATAVERGHSGVHSAGHGDQHSGHGHGQQQVRFSGHGQQAHDHQGVSGHGHGDHHGEQGYVQQQHHGVHDQQGHHGH